MWMDECIIDLSKQFISKFIKDNGVFNLYYIDIFDV